MELKIESKPLGDAAVVVPQVFQDERGFFMETFRADQFETLGLPWEFVQDNHSGSVKGVLRGLDIRKGSPTLGKWFGVEATEENRRMVWAPAGFARGFCVTSDYAEIQYKCTGIYNNKGESGIRWDDPAIGIRWPVKDALLSDKDRKAQSLAEWLASPFSENFKYENRQS
jgi:dTDP-4-dehydrorhamnose 3,5-epimerase